MNKRNKIRLLHLLALGLIVFSIPAQGETRQADTGRSELIWSAKKVTGGHTGTVTLKSGYLELADGSVTGGKFIIDMNSITNSDIGSAAMRNKLLGHLKSDDFFSAARYPEAVLVITDVDIYSKKKADVTADLTIKGQTHPVRFTVEEVDGYYRSRINVDRSRYDIRYGSNSFFDNLGDKTIEDIFSLDVKLVLK